MNTQRFPGQVVLKSILVVLLVMLAFQGIGINGLAAPAPSSRDLQEGGNPPVLTCGCASIHIQIVLLIDDSGSMRTNDPQFTRDQGAKDLVDGLATLQDVQVAVIHFTEGVKENLGWMEINPGNLDELHKQIDQNREVAYTLEGTNFLAPLREAKTLFMQAATGDCTRRSTLLFTDGILEDGQGMLHGDRLLGVAEAVSSSVQELYRLNAEVYFMGLNFGPAPDEVEALWSMILGFPTNDQLEDPSPFASRMETIIASLSNRQQKGDFTELSRYQTMTVNFEDQPVQLQQGKQSDIKFRLVDRSGKGVLPGDDPAYNLELKVSVIQGTEEMLEWAQDGDRYQVSWTPKSSGIGQFKVLAHLVDAKGHVLLNCSGATAELQIDPSIPTPTGTLPPSSTPDGTITATSTPTPPITCIGCPPPQCLACDGLWKFWFWPLAILLAGLLIVLLVLRFRKSDQEEQQDRSRRSQWHLLFLPSLILLVFLVLNRLWWCCVIPPWLFLALILILIIIPLPVSLIPRDIPARRRPWWLALLLLLLVLIWFFLPRITIPAIALILFSIWSIRWFILPIPGPVPPPGPGPDDRPEEKKNDNPPARDDLTEIEGIEEDIEKLLNTKGIHTFKELVKTDGRIIKDWLNEQRLYMIDPTTWPKQARLADIARESGQEMDGNLFNDYKDYLKGGRLPGKGKTHVPDHPGRSRKDDLTLIEGIGPRVAELLNESGITTFEELAERDIEKIQSLLNEKNLQYKNPKTWPLQARLADIASASGKKEDWDVFKAYLTYLKDGFPPEEWNKPEGK